MYWTGDRTWFSVAVALFAAATTYAVFLWRRGFSRNDWGCYGLLAAAIVPNTAALLARGFTLQRCPVHNLYEATMFVSWTVLLCHLVAGLWSRLRFLTAIAAPVLLALGVFAMNPQLDSPGPALDMSHALVSLHAAIVLLAYGTFGLSAAAAIMYLMQERDLKLRKLRAVLSLLPPIDRLEKVVAQALATGFALLTVGLLLSIWLVANSTKPIVRGDPKVAWSLLVWAGYLAILTVRLLQKRGARWLAWSSLGTFAFVMLTFWGTNLMSPMHQP